MIWLNTFFYFALYSLYLLVGTFLYGEALLFFVKRNSIFKNIYIFLIYVIFTIFIVYPIFLIFDFIQGFNRYILESNFFVIFVVICFIFSVIPMFLYFRRKYLKSLQAFGLF